MRAITVQGGVVEITIQYEQPSGVLFIETHRTRAILFKNPRAMHVGCNDPSIARVQHDLKVLNLHRYQGHHDKHI